MDDLFRLTSFSTLIVDMLCLLHLLSPYKKKSFYKVATPCTAHCAFYYLNYDTMFDISR